MIHDFHSAMPPDISPIRWGDDAEDGFRKWHRCARPLWVSTAAKSRRFHIPDSMGTGHWERVDFEPGFVLLVNRANYSTPSIFSCEGEGLLKFHFRLAARSAIYVETLGHIPLEGAACQLFYHPYGLVDYECISDGPVDSWVSIFCTPEFIFDNLCADPSLLPQKLLSAISKGVGEPFISDIPFVVAMRMLCQQIALCGFSGSLRTKYLEGLTLQLLCEAVARLNEEERAKGLDLLEKDIRAIHDAHTILSESFRDPPSISAIARRVGVNRTKLQSGFKAIYSITLQEYCVERRMNLGKKLLEETEEPIARIAELVGYEHPNNFSSAFKRVYGFSPRHSRP